MKATYTTDYHEEGFFSLDFVARNDEYRLTFGLPGNQVMLSTKPPSTRTSLTQFIFECNAITFHPKATKDFYMLLFHTAIGKQVSAKLLLAGNSRGVTNMIHYSISSTEIDGEIEFPRQL
jgi:hypothetical protein